jgi:class 3 adenylate cyclase
MAGLKASISLKIFSIAVTLVVLMAIVSALSTRNLALVSAQISAISDFYLPMQRELENARGSSARQVIALERMLSARSRTDRKHVEDQEEEFLQRGREADAHVIQAIVIADKAIKSGKLPADEEQLLEQLRGRELPRVLEARQHLQLTTHKYVQELDAGDRKAIDLFRGVVDDERAMVSKQVGQAASAVAQLVLTSAQEANVEERRALFLNWTLTVIAALLGLVLAAFITRGLVRPVKDLLIGTRALEGGNLDIEVRVKSGDEIGDLTQSFNHMVSQIREKRSITETFGKYVDPRIVKRLLEDKGALEGERRVMTVFFSDIEGFTGLCETLTPDGAVRCLNRYFTLASAPIREANGIIDKYIGDAIMAFWGPPFTDEREHATLACRAALAQLDKAEELKRQLSEVTGLRKGLPEMKARVGLATGEVTMGNIGSDTTKGFTVIGDTVNLASRLEGANKFYGTRLLISDATRELAKDSIETREIDALRVKGKTEPVRVHELLAMKGTLDARSAKLREEFEAGLAAYRQADWNAAEARFHACLALKPEDGPAAVYLERVKHFRLDPPPPGAWDGIWSFSEK